MIRHSKWAMIVCFGLLACSDDDSGIISPTESEPEASMATTLTLTQDQYTLVSLGASANLRVTATDQYGVYMANPAITWSTSDSLNVNVNSRGLITAMSQGTAIITAQAGTATTTASVTVKQEAADLAFTEDIIRFEVIQDTTRLVPIVKDSRGNLIDPFEATWSSGNESIVTVDNEGLITSVGNGRTGITMSSGSISESLPVIVATDGLITISSITPSVLTEGSSGVIVGTGLWGTSGNQLTIGGHSVQVTAATRSQVDFILPSFNCLPPRTEQLTLKNTNDSTGAAVTVQPETLSSLVTGQTVVATDGCIQLDKGAIGGKYLIGALNSREDPGSLVDAVIEIKAGLDTSADIFVERIPHIGPPKSFSQENVRTSEYGFTARQGEPMISLTNSIFGKHVEGEQQIRTNEQLLIEEIGIEEIREGIKNSLKAFSLQSDFNPDLIVGDTVPFNMGLSCASGDTLQIQAKIAFVGNETLWYEDLANPLTESFTQTEYQTFDDKYAQTTLPALQDYFGNYGDIDSNGKLSILITKEVNRRKNVLGFVWGGDLVPDNLCPGGNTSEIFYGLAPDPEGVIEREWSKSFLTSIYEPLIAHETTHVIQFTRQFYEGAQNKSSWEIEGGATLAEQLVGYRIYGHDSGINLGLAEYNAGFKWYRDWASDLTYYFGNSDSGKIDGAPEQCSWLGKESQGNSGPCRNLRAVYGVPSIFIRMILDLYGPTYPGGEKALSRDLVGATDSGGLSNFEQRTGIGRKELLTTFAMTLWGDGIISDNLTSWNIHDVMQGWAEDGKLQPYVRMGEDETLNVSVRGGSNAYLEWSPTMQHAPTSLHVRDPLGSLPPSDMVLWIQKIE